MNEQQILEQAVADSEYKPEDVLALIFGKEHSTKVSTIDYFLLTQRGRSEFIMQGKDTMLYLKLKTKASCGTANLKDFLEGYSERFKKILEDYKKERLRPIGGGRVFVIYNQK